MDTAVDTTAGEVVEDTAARINALLSGADRVKLETVRGEALTF